MGAAYSAFRALAAYPAADNWVWDAWAALVRGPGTWEFRVSRAGNAQVVAGKSRAACKAAAQTSQSPAACASPRAASLSRNIPASSGRNPRMRASVEAAAVWSLMLTSPNARSIGPATTSTSCIRP